jgi:CubicO group peptidase (beta-lactamase class C family)
MLRRQFLGTALIAAGATSGVNLRPLIAAVCAGRWDAATDVLERAASAGTVAAAVIHVVQKDETLSRHFGTAHSPEAMFLLGSVSKPINIAAVMTLFDQGQFQLDDPVRKFLPAFQGQGRDDVTIGHLMTHRSGLPDQLPDNDVLRKRHAPLDAFVERTLRTPLSFAPGTRYHYSSMGILLAAWIGHQLAGEDVRTLVERSVFAPLGMSRSAQGLGRFTLEEMLPCQMEGAAPESGGGDPEAALWNWNSRYWRELGAPWGGTHASAPDIARFLDEFLYARGKIVRPETARLMITSRNPPGLRPRGLGFDVGSDAGSPGCSGQTFGHTGSTGTLCWADPATDTICVVLTTLPRRAQSPHPRELAAEQVAIATQG